MHVFSGLRALSVLLRLFGGHWAGGSPERMTLRAFHAHALLRQKQLTGKAALPPIHALTPNPTIFPF